MSFWQTQLGKLDAIDAIALYMNSLSGMLPTQLAALGNLSSLDVTSNLISGTLDRLLGPAAAVEPPLAFPPSSPPPPSPGGHLPYMVGHALWPDATSLLLSENRMSGTISPLLGALTKLRLLHANGNPISGTLPAALAVGAQYALHAQDASSSMSSSSGQQPSSSQQPSSTAPDAPSSPAANTPISTEGDTISTEGDGGTQATANALEAVHLSGTKISGSFPSQLTLALTLALP